MLRRNTMQEIIDMKMRGYSIQRNCRTLRGEAREASVAADDPEVLRHECRT